MSTAESELVAILISNCMKATEHLAAGVLLGDYRKQALVKKVIYSDSPPVPGELGISASEDT